MSLVIFTLFHGHREPPGPVGPYGSLEYISENPVRDGNDGLAMEGVIVEVSEVFAPSIAVIVNHLDLTVATDHNQWESRRDGNNL